MGSITVLALGVVVFLNISFLEDQQNLKIRDFIIIGALAAAGIGTYVACKAYIESQGSRLCVSATLSNRIASSIRLYYCVSLVMIVLQFNGSSDNQSVNVSPWRCPARSQKQLLGPRYLNRSVATVTRWKNRTNQSENSACVHIASAHSCAVLRRSVYRLPGGCRLQSTRERSRTGCVRSTAPHIIRIS